jgi:hypothetical protein
LKERRSEPRKAASPAVITSSTVELFWYCGARGSTWPMKKRTPRGPSMVSEQQKAPTERGFSCRDEENNPTPCVARYRVGHHTMRPFGTAVTRFIGRSTNRLQDGLEPPAATRKALAQPTHPFKPLEPNVGITAVPNARYGVLRLMWVFSGQLCSGNTSMAHTRAAPTRSVSPVLSICLWEEMWVQLKIGLKP